MSRRIVDPHVAVVTVRLSAAGVALVWLLVSLGGMQNPGFKQYEQYLSILGAEGTASPGWGRAALVVTGLAILVLVPAMAAWRMALGALAVMAGVAAIAVSQLPMSCPGGARFCSAPGQGVDTAHSIAVLVFAAAVTALLFAGARQLAAGGVASPRLWPTVASAVLVVAVCGPALLTVSGLPQRILLLAVQVLIVALGAASAAELHRRHRAVRKERAASGPERVTVGSVS